MSTRTSAVREPPDYGQLATDLADMARELLAQKSIQQTVDSVVGHAVKLVDGCDAAGILTIEKGSVHTVAATDPGVRVSDRMQAQLSEGPCFDAVVHRERVYRIEDMHQGHRWPAYGRRASALGVGSMMGFLLYTNGTDSLGALDLYSSRRGAFPRNAEHVGWVLASHAAVALYNARHAENMERALESSRSIGQAIGVVMSRHKLAEQAAFDAIRRLSRDRNVKVRELADEIVRAGELPENLSPHRP